jgi:hypothetical protein
LAYEPWPEADESLLVVDTINLPVQVGEWTQSFGVAVASSNLVGGCAMCFVLRHVFGGAHSCASYRAEILVERARLNERLGHSSRLV